MLTNWDLLARLMSVSLLAATYAECANAIAEMERRERYARIELGNTKLVNAVLHETGTRTRVRHRKAA